MCQVWVFSSEANNFGTFLLGVVSAVTLSSGIFYFIWFRKEKNLEKRSNIAEESLISLEHFIFLVTEWISRSSTWFLYSRHSKANKHQLEEASEEKRRELNKMYEKDPYELRNHCESFREMMRDFFHAKNRASHLESQSLDNKFRELEGVLQKFPGKLCSFHQLNDSEEMWPDKGSEKAQSWQFIADEGPEKVRTISEAIKPELRKIMLYKK